MTERLFVESFSPDLAFHAHAAGLGTLPPLPYVLERV